MHWVEVLMFSFLNLFEIKIIIAKVNKFSKNTKKFIIYLFLLILFIQVLHKNNTIAKNITVYLHYLFSIFQDFRKFDCFVSAKTK